MTTPQRQRLDNAKNQVLMLVKDSEELNFDYQLEREIFFANDAAIKRIINAMENEVTHLDMEGLLTTDEYKVWTAIIDSLRRL